MTKQKVFVLLTETSTHANVEVYATRKEYQLRKDEVIETMQAGEFVAVRKNLIFQPDGGLPTLKPLSLRAPLGDVSISLEAIRKFASVNNLELYSRGRDTINFQLLLVGQLAGLFTEEFCKETLFTNTPKGINADFEGDLPSEVGTDATPESIFVYPVAVLGTVDNMPMVMVRFPKSDHDRKVMLRETHLSFIKHDVMDIPDDVSPYGVNLKSGDSLVAHEGARIQYSREGVELKYISPDERVERTGDGFVLNYDTAAIGGAIILSERAGIDFMADYCSTTDWHRKGKDAVDGQALNPAVDERYLADEVDEHEMAVVDEREMREPGPQRRNRPFSRGPRQARSCFEMRAVVTKL